MISRSVARWGVIGAAALALSACVSAPSLRLDAGDFSAHQEDSTVVVDHEPWRVFLETYAAEGADGVRRIAYDAVAEEDSSALTYYVARQRRVRLDALNRAEQFAFWVNLYNALVVRLILENGAPATFADLAIGPRGRGPRDIGTALISGRLVSLADIERVALRGGFADPRIHYALTDAALGDPNVAAFEAAELDAQLTEAARRFVNHPRGARPLRPGVVGLARLYFEHRSDFGETEEALKRHLRRYADPDLARAIRAAERFEPLPYDDRLNDLSPQGAAGRSGA